MRSLSQVDFIVAIAITVGTVVLAVVCATRFNIDPMYTLLGLFGLLWLALNIIQRWLDKRHAAGPSNLIRRILTDDGEKLVWPQLPDSPLVRGRAATARDVRRGHAVIVMSDIAPGPWEAVSIELPQYAALKLDDPPEVCPIAVLQAESNGTDTYVGYLDLESGTLEFAHLNEVELFGRRPPDRLSGV